MHDDCLRHEILMRVYERLGKATPQVFSKEDVVKKEGDEAMTSEPPQENKEDGNTETSIALAKLPLFTPPVPPSATPSSKKGPRKEPYRGLFDAKLKLEADTPPLTPAAWHITDLRENVTGGAKEWLERSRCLFCASLID